MSMTCPILECTYIHDHEYTAAVTELHSYVYIGSMQVTEGTLLSLKKSV